jgi:hypothetical protein
MSEEKSSPVRLAGLAAAFNEAVARKYENDPVIEQKILASLSGADISRLMQLRTETEEMAMPYLLGEGDPAELEEKLAPTVIEVVEIFTRAASGTLPASELAECMPEEAKNEETAAAFAAQGAPTLARLCRL